jgi:hypothetical protein
MVFPTDWVIQKENPSTIVGIDGSTPIVGLGSMQVFVTDAPERVAIQNNTYTNGILDGRIRANVRIDDMTTDVIDHVGFVCMQSAPTIDGASDEGYGLVLSGDNGLSTATVNLVKYTNGFQSLIILDSVSAGSLGIGTPFVFQLDWVEEALLNGVVLKGYIGVTTVDFNDLVQVVEFTDTSSPLTTSVAEGLVVVSLSTISPTLDVKFDNVSIFSLIF